MAIQLTKGQKISLKKENGDAEVKTILLGLGWDVGRHQQIDLDASCATIDSGKNVLEYVYFGNKNNRTKSILHSGDNPTTGVIMARLYRHNGEWKFAAIGEGANGQTIKDMVKPIQAILG